MPDISMLWNLVLSIAAGATVWWVRGVDTRIMEVRKLISVTREEIAKEYALKNDVEKDIQKLLDRFDRLETKLDRILERMVLDGKK
jgi:hypothetical protein